MYARLLEHVTIMFTLASDCESAFCNGAVSDLISLHKIITDQLMYAMLLRGSLEVFNETLLVIVLYVGVCQFCCCLLSLISLHRIVMDQLMYARLLKGSLHVFNEILLVIVLYVGVCQLYCCLLSLISLLNFFMYARLLKVLQ